MQLYSRWQNSAGERVRIALNLKGVPYDYVAVGSLAPGEYGRLNPQGLMPALRAGGTVVAQSTAILEYIEEAHPLPPLLPADPILRAQARALRSSSPATCIRSTTTASADTSPTEWGRATRTCSPGTGTGSRWRWPRWRPLWPPARGTGPVCFGDAPGWADLHLVPQVANARRFGCNLSPYPRLVAVDARCAALEAFRRARPEAQADYPGAPN